MCTMGSTPKATGSSETISYSVLYLKVYVRLSNIIHIHLSILSLCARSVISVAAVCLSGLPVCINYATYHLNLYLSHTVSVCVFHA